jgi:glycosyltransferase involved in cell wall biosynthesis
MPEIWFWQTIVSPHMTGLAVSLAQRGCKITYVAEQVMTADRASLGWTVPRLLDVSLFTADSSAALGDLVEKAPPDSVHICQGIRSNGVIGVVQRALAARGLRQWIVMEAVYDAGWFGTLKRAEYRRLFSARKTSLQGVLATGQATADWVTKRGFSAEGVFPFAYFLPESLVPLKSYQRGRTQFRFVFVGRLIPLKRVNLLLNALNDLSDWAFELYVVGSGPERSALQAIAERDLPDRVRWVGQLPMSEIPDILANADCLVLPSVHEGWGAVASEALMAGTPVVCSDACGVAGAVHASGVGGVFPINEIQSLKLLLANQLALGKVTAIGRRAISAWATCLGAASGADYLLKILAYKENGQGVRPVAPWLMGN